jgi:hypothetical protein
MSRISSIFAVILFFFFYSILLSQDSNNKTPSTIQSNNNEIKKEKNKFLNESNAKERESVINRHIPSDVLLTMNKSNNLVTQNIAVTNPNLTRRPDSLFINQEKRGIKETRDKIQVFTLGNVKTATDYVFLPTTGTYTEITGTNAGITGDDALSAAINIGFTFNYSGSSYTQIKISTNGWLCLGIGESNYYLGNALNGTYLSPIIAPLWDDLASNNVQYITTGTAPNRILTVQWKNTQWNYGGAASQNFQVKLYETTNMIQFVYGSMAAPNNASASIGINDMTAGAGHFWSVTPGSPAAGSSTISNDTISTINYLTSGIIYEFLPKTYNFITPSTAIQNASYLSQTVAMWNFNASAGTTYSFSLCSDAEDSKVWIYNTAGALVASLDDYGPYCSSASASIIWSCPAAGSYYIVSGYWSGSVFINSNSMMYTIFPMNVNTYSGWLYPSTTTNTAGYNSNTFPVWSFSAAAGTSYGFSLCADGEDSQIWIYDVNNNLIGNVDDMGPYCTSSMSASLVWTCETTGTYFVIGGYYSGSNFTATSTLSYQTFSSPPPYQTYYSSTWNNTFAWQVSIDGGTTWGRACEPPSTKYGNTTILSSHTINLSSNVATDQLTINSGGNLTINSGNILTVNDGTGTDLNVNGILDNSGTITNNGQIAVNNGGTYYHRVDGGTIPTAAWGLSSTCYITGTKTQNPPVPTGFDQNFGNLTWDCASQSYWGWIPTTMQGNLTLTNGFLTSSYSVNRNSTVNGSLNMNGGNLAISTGTGIGGLTINGNISQSSGVFQNMIGTGTASLELKGNWTNSGGTYSSNTGSVIFDGTASQSIPALTFYSMTVNNSAGIVLSGAVNTTGLILTSGNITTTSSNILTVTGTSPSNITRTNGCVSGPMKITLPSSLVSGSTYLLPLGKSAYNPVELVNPITSSGGSVIIQAEVFDGNCGGTAGQGLTSLNTNRYWNTSFPSGAANFTSAFIRLTETGTLTGMAIGECSTINGTYTCIGKTVSGQTVMSNIINEPGYLALGNSNVSAMSGIYYVGLSLFNKVSGNNLIPKSEKHLTKETYPVHTKDKNKPLRYETRTVETEDYILTENGNEYKGSLYAESKEGIKDGPDAIRVYSSISAAITDLNSRGVSGAVTFLLTDASFIYESFPITINQVSGSSASNTITFKPASGVTASISGSSSTGIFNLNGADYIIFDGSNSGGSDKSLTIVNTNSSSGTYGINMYGNANYNVVKNCNVKSEYQPAYLTNADNCEITGNNIYGNASGNTNTYQAGISIGPGSTNTKIRKNIIHDFYYTSTGGYGTFGIYYSAEATSTTEISNNIIYTIKAGGDPGAIYWDPAGIYINSGGNIQIFNNSIYMTGDVLGAGNYNGYSSCISINSSITALDIRNNALRNSMGRLASETSSPSLFVIRCNSANTAFGYINYNDYYYTDQPNVTEFTGYLGSNIASLADWKTATGKDINSWASDPVFTSASNLMPNTTNPNCWVLNGKGYPLSAVTTDINGNSRSSQIMTGPIDIGAYEFTPSGAGITPPAATANFAPGGNVISTYTLFGKIVARIFWYPGGTYPASMNLRYYSQTVPPNIGSNNSSLAYWEILPAGTYSCTYDITLNFGDNETYTVSTPSTGTRMAKYNGTVWTGYINAGTGTGQSDLDWNAKTVTVRGLTDFSIFALTDQNAPLPVELASFSYSVNNRNVKLFWSTSSERNNAGFEIQKSEAAGNYSDWIKTGYAEGKGTTNNSTSYNYTDTKLNTGKYKYRLKQIDLNGNFTYHNLDAVVEIGVPKSFELSQNYPNPFNPVTKIDFALPFDGNVNVAVYDILGKEVKTIVNENHKAGYYTTEFAGNNFSSGIYLYRIIVKAVDGKSFSMTKKMMLVK